MMRVAALFFWLFALTILSTSAQTEELPASEPLTSHLADMAEQQNWTAVKHLLESGAAANAAQSGGMTALHWAVFHNHQLSAELLLKAKANPNVPTRYDVTPLTIASRAGKVKLMKVLLAAGGDARTKLPGGETLLMMASRTGSTGALQVLLAAGAEVDATERRGQTALMWAAADGHVGVVKELLAAGAERDRTVKSGFNALHFAAREGKQQVVEALVAAGSDVREAMKGTRGGQRKPRGRTSALLLAVESGHFQLALRLVELGADPNDQRSGFTPLHVLTWVRKTNRGDDPSGDPPPRGSGSVTSLQFARHLAAAGADVNTRLERGGRGTAKLTLEGATPFLMAAKTADLPLMKLLVELGADPQITNIDGTTPLMATTGIGVVAVGEEAGTEPEVLAAAAWLLDLGIDINHQDENGETAMHGAAYRNFPRAVELLARRGADPAVWDVKNSYGWTPVMIAQGKRPGSLKPSPETIAALEAARQQVAAKAR